MIYNLYFYFQPLLSKCGSTVLQRLVFPVPKPHRQCALFRETASLADNPLKGKGSEESTGPVDGRDFFDFDDTNRGGLDEKSASADGALHVIAPLHHTRDKNNPLSYGHYLPK